MNEELLRAIATTPVMSHKNFALYHAGETGNDFFDTDFFLSDADVRSSLVDELVELIEEDFDVSSYDKIAFLDKDYGPVGTIIYASKIADEFGMDMVVIRVKDHLELRFDDLKVKGDLDKGDSVLIVDDVINTGGTQRRAMEIVEDLGGVPKGVLCVFARDPEVLDEMTDEWDVGGVTTAASLFTHESLDHLGLSLAEEPEDYFQEDFAAEFVDLLMEGGEAEATKVELRRQLDDSLSELFGEGELPEDENSRRALRNAYLNTSVFLSREKVYGN